MGELRLDFIKPSVASRCEVFLEHEPNELLESKADYVSQHMIVESWELLFHFPPFYERVNLISREDRRDFSTFNDAMYQVEDFNVLHATLLAQLAHRPGRQLYKHNNHSFFKEEILYRSEEHRIESTSR